MLLGARLYFSFHPEAIDTHADFLKQVDLVERELGQRGKLRAEEGVPPAGAAPALVPASSRAPAPTSLRSQALEPTDHGQVSNTPSMRITSNAAFQEALGADESSLLHLMLEREQKLREESKAELEQQLDRLRAELMPVEAISTEQMHGLQERLDALHGAELLSDGELYSLENLIAVSLYPATRASCVRTSMRGRAEL
eukprot:SAG11_NODE_372_length_10036_cov_8.820871_8_plen_198_part_00